MCVFLEKRRDGCVHNGGTHLRVGWSSIHSHIPSQEILYLRCS